MDGWGERERQVSPGDSIAMAIALGIAGAIVVFVATLLLGRAIDGVTTSWPAPETVLDALLVWVFSRLHLIFAVVGFLTLGARVAHTITHDRDQAHYQANARLDVDLDREREEVRRMRLENDLASAKLAAFLAKPAEQQRELLITDRATSHWSLTVSRGRDKVEIAGRLVEAYARGLRAGKTDLRDYLRREENVSFENRHYSILRVLMEQGGVTSAKGVDTQRLAEQLDLWRSTRVARVYESHPLTIDGEQA